MNTMTLESTKAINPNLDRLIKAPGAYYSMLTADSVEHQFAKGTLSVSSDRSIGETAQFPLFSITKTFTAIGILRLQEAGMLNIDDQLASYLPGYSRFGELTIRQLLSHQSGLNNPIPLSWIHLAAEETEYDYSAFPKTILESKAKVRARPGRKAVYSNLNFLLLGEIIQAVSGMPYRQYMEERLLQDYPEISFHWNDNEAVTGYHDAGFAGWVLGLLMDKAKFTESKVDGLIPIKKLYLNGSAYGGLLATPRALNRFLQDLLNEKILSARSLEMMFQEQLLASDRLSGHSLGWFTGQCNTQYYCHHAGGGGGHYLELRVYPHLRIASYVLTNKSGFSDQRLLDKIDAQLLP